MHLAGVRRACMADTVVVVDGGVEARSHLLVAVGLDTHDTAGVPHLNLHVREALLGHGVALRVTRRLGAIRDGVGLDAGNGEVHRAAGQSADLGAVVAGGHM